MPKPSWTLRATIRTPIPAMPPPHAPVVLPGRGREVTFEQSEVHDNYAWPRYSRLVSRRAWDYKVTIRIFDKRYDAQEIARDLWASLDRLTAALSFGFSEPVSIVDYGSVTNAPRDTIPGEEYVTLIHSDEITVEESISSIDNLKTIKQACQNGFLTEDMERIHRSMWWLQQSHYAHTPAEEYICIMIGLESLTGHLGVLPTYPWRCGHCEVQIPNCPHCGAGTDRPGSGEAILRKFVSNELKWPRKEWQMAWKLRNILVHGQKGRIRF
jgi:hypothetical protein